jgi:UDP-GlcNAc:undecaprenyl-phosphate GlcNAc-1-phosphate transferase
MDGLSACRAVSAGGLFIAAWLQGDQTIVFMLAALIGSLWILKVNGTLRGSTWATRAQCSSGCAGRNGHDRQISERPSALVLTPVFILGIPIFDTLFVMWIRYQRGLPIFGAARSHRDPLAALGHDGTGSCS